MIIASMTFHNRVTELDALASGFESPGSDFVVVMDGDADRSPMNR